jgi:hypothetical protein
MTTGAVASRAASTAPRWSSLLVGGRWLPLCFDQSVDVRSPHDPRLVGRVPTATSDEYFELKSIAP